MMKCKFCDKEFEKYQQLAGHMRVHNESNGSYKVSRAKPRPSFTCLNCEVTKEYSPTQSYGKFCSIKCQHEYHWKTIRKPKIMRGEGGNIRRYLTEEYGYECTECHINEWQGKPLTLQVDHRDGNSDNNSPENLRFLCPNCHSQTPTFVGRNKKNTKRNSYLSRYKKALRS